MSRTQPKLQPKPTHQLLDSEGQPIQLPHITTYQRADNGATWYAQVEAFSPPKPSPLTQLRERGAVTVTHSPSADGPWGPPYRGIDPAQLGLQIKEEPSA